MFCLELCHCECNRSYWMCFVVCYFEVCKCFTNISQDFENPFCLPLNRTVFLHTKQKAHQLKWKLHCRHPPLCRVFMVYTWNDVSRVYWVAAILYLQFVLHVMLFHTWNMFCTFTLALSKVCVLCRIWLFFVVPWFFAFLVCCLGIAWMILRWLQLPLISSSSSFSSTFLNSQQFSWFWKEYGSHWPSTSYSLFCQNLSYYTACIKYYCCPHRICRAGWGLSSSKLPCNLFRIMPIVILLVILYRLFSVAIFL